MRCRSILLSIFTLSFGGQCSGARLRIFRQQDQLQNGLERIMRAINLPGTARTIRIFLGLLFLSTGVMKYAVPNLRAAFSGQLTAAGIPFHTLNMWVVPAAEIVLGALFILAQVRQFGRKCADCELHWA